MNEKTRTLLVELLDRAQKSVQHTNDVLFAHEYTTAAHHIMKQLVKLEHLGKQATVYEWANLRKLTDAAQEMIDIHDAAAWRQ